MNLAPYRQVLALPGMRALIIIGMFARIPAVASALTVTLHVVSTLGLQFTEAGIAGAAAMIGGGIGAPIAGRLVDRLGMRRVMSVTVIAQGVYWSTAPFMSYGTLVASAFLAGLLSIPIFSVMRQFVAAMAPQEQRRPAYALDSMAVEMSYMVGPALAVACVTSFGSRPTMFGVGAGIVLAGLAIIVMNPPTRSEREQEDFTVVPRRQWLRPGLIMLLAASAAATFVLTATELSIVATLRDAGTAQWTGLVIGIWCLYSLVGGFTYGGLNRPISPMVIMGALCALTIPLALVNGGWWWYLLALLPAGLFCAPALASSVDNLSKLVPAGARGEAMGLHGTALTVGIAIGGPFAGAIIDGLGPRWGFAGAGLAGLLIVAIAVPFWRRISASVPAPSTEVTMVGAGAR